MFWNGWTQLGSTREILVPKEPDKQAIYFKDSDGNEAYFI